MLFNLPKTELAIALFPAFMNDSHQHFPIVINLIFPALMHIPTLAVSFSTLLVKHK